MEATDNSYSNIVTPPDLVSESKHTVLVIDATNDEVNALGRYLKESSQPFNVYLYNQAMDDLEWMALVGDRAHAIVIHSIENEFSEVKEKLIDLPNCYYYGPKSFNGSNRQITGPIDYFTEYIKTL